MIFLQDKNVSWNGIAREMVWSVVSRLDAVTHTTNTPRSRITDEYKNHLHSDPPSSGHDDSRASVVLELVQVHAIALLFPLPSYNPLRLSEYSHIKPI